jgi:predicted metal-binding membrane protein
VLFSRWSAEPGAIFRLGAEQGLSCLGCCAGLMAATLATGVMNPFWMALIAVFSAVEKQLDSAFPGRLAGAILLVWAASLLVMSV